MNVCDSKTSNCEVGRKFHDTSGRNNRIGFSKNVCCTVCREENKILFVIFYGKILVSQAVCFVFHLIKKSNFNKTIETSCVQEIKFTHNSETFLNSVLKFCQCFEHFVTKKIIILDFHFFTMQANTLCSIFFFEK